MKGTPRVKEENGKTERGENTGIGAANESVKEGLFTKKANPVVRLGSKGGVGPRRQRQKQVVTDKTRVPPGGGDLGKMNENGVKLIWST